MANADFQDLLPQLKEKLGMKWGWFVAIGVVLIFLGLLALGNQFLATVFTIYYLGALMVIAGIFQIIHAFQIRGVGLSLCWAVAGLLYAIAGIFAFANPVLASSVLTLLLAFALLASGIIRLWQGFKARGYNVGSGWIMFSGALSLLLGILIVADWPISGLWIIGLFLGIDLLFQGWGYIIFGYGIKPAKK